MTHKRKTPIRFRTGDKIMCLGAGRSGREVCVVMDDQLATGVSVHCHPIGKDGCLFWSDKHIVPLSEFQSEIA